MGSRTPSSGPTRYGPAPRPSCSKKSLPETAVHDRPAPCCETNRTPPSGSANPSGATSTPCTWPPKTSSARVQYRQCRPLPTGCCPAYQTSRHGRRCAATCCSSPPPAPTQSLNCSSLLQRGTSPAPMIRLLSSIRGSKTSTRSPPEGRCRGCRAFPASLPPTPTGDHTWTPDPSWLLSSPTRSASTLQLKRQPGRPSDTLPCRPS